MIRNIIIEDNIDIISAMSALYNLSFQEANYLQTRLPKNYSLQAVSTDTKRQRSARKMDDIFTDDFGSITKKGSKQKIAVKQDNSHIQISANKKFASHGQNKGKNSSDDFIESKQQKKKKNQSKNGIDQLCISKILQRLKTARCSWPFRQPVDPISQGVPNYLQIIKQPMDLQTIERKLKNGGYSNDEEFHDDVKKIITNSFTFNPNETNYYKLTKQFETIYKQVIYEVNNSQSNVNKKNTRQKKPEQQKPNSNSKIIQQVVSKPSSLRLHKAEKLSVKEREKLFHQLYGLSQQKIVNLIKIFDNGTLQTGWKDFQIDFNKLQDDQYDQILSLLKES